MNKESIYRIIGYKGEYNNNVKKAIRKLLKENHPDNNGDRKIFELINEVKKELEENKVSINYKKNQSNIPVGDDIDYLYCSKMIDKITKEKEAYQKAYDKKKKELADVIDNYNSIYYNGIDLETNLLSSSQHIEKLEMTKILSIVLLILATISFTISVLTKNIIFLCLFVALTFICVIIIHRGFFTIQKLAETNRKKVKKYVRINNEIRENQTNQKELKEELREINKWKMIVDFMRIY